MELAKDFASKDLPKSDMNTRKNFFKAFTNKQATRISKKPAKASGSDQPLLKRLKSKMSLDEEPESEACDGEELDDDDDVDDNDDEEAQGEEECAEDFDIEAEDFPSLESCMPPERGMMG